LVHLGVEAEKQGVAPDPATAASHEQKVIFDVLVQSLQESDDRWTRIAPRSAGSPRRPRPASTVSTT